MMTNSYRTIPLPEFAFADVINRKAIKFSDYQLRGPLYHVRDLGDKVQSELWGLSTDADRVQYIGYLVNHVVGIIAVHESKCHNESCQVGPEGQEFLYFLYGKLSESGLKIEGDTFTSSEIAQNNFNINELTFKIDELKVGEHVLFDEIGSVAEQIASLKTDVAELKNLYVLGKKKWYQQLYGIIFENMANKGIDELMMELGPLLTKLGHDTVKYYLQAKS